MTKRTPIEGTALHFRVDFGGMTDRAREFWAEEKYAFAFRVLEEGFHLSREQAVSVLNGRMKMAQFPGGVEGCEGTLVADTWKPADSGFGFYPSPGDPLLAAECAALKREVHELRRRLGDDQLPHILDDEEPQEFRARTLAEIHSGAFGNADPMEARVQQLNMEYALKAQAKASLEFQLEADTKPTPGPDTTYASGNGWVTSAGKFYPCENPMQHVWLAGRLGKTEAQAEDAGWVKLSTSFMGIHVFSKRRPSQRQIDTVFAWAGRKGQSQREAVAKEWLDRETR